MSPANAVPTLTVTGGPHDGQALSLLPGGERVLGSADGVSLKLGLQNVADRHARVLFDPARGVVISDLGTATGTYVNGEKLEAERIIAVGDRVCLGPPGAKASVKLLLVTAPAAETSEEPAIILDGDSSVSLEPAAEPAIILDDAPAPPPPPPPPPPAPKPAAAPPPPPTALAPAPPAAPPAAPAAAKPDAAKREKPQYTDDPPSIVPTMQRQPLPVPPPPPVDLKARLEAKKKTSLPVPRVAIIGGAVAVVLGLGWLATRSFLSGPPAITSILPPRVEGGQTVTLAGSNFGTDAAAVSVRVGDRAGKIVSANDTQIAVQVPDIDPDNGAADFQVTVETRKGRSNALPVTVTALPRLTAFQPDVVMPGDEVVATGKHLKGKPIALSVDGQDGEVLEAAGDRLRFRVPQVQVIPGRAAAVVVRVGKEQSKPANVYLGKLPLLIDTTPVRAQAGDLVTLKGRGLAARPEGNLVRFGSEPALVISASERELVAAVPGASVIATQIDAPVTIETATGRSNVAPFITQRLSSGVYLPRYFPVPMPDRPGIVTVSTELGPVMVMGGRGDAASPAERAVKLAAALNGLVDEALKKAVELEARDNVMAVKGGAVLAAVTPEDLAAYESLEGAPKGRRASARTVAVLWAAIVQEQIDLFARRQRPGRLLEVTPRGRAMMSLYSEALRRAGAGGGVPLSVVSPLPTGLSRDLREMALLLPTEGQGSAAAAMEGRWQGTMWEEGSGEKPIVVRLRLTGSKLGGSLTATAGGITGDVPLQDAAFDKGVLRFGVMVGGSRQQFEGKVDGDKVSGSISRPGTSGSAGRFTLAYAE